MCRREPNWGTVSRQFRKKAHALSGAVASIAVMPKEMACESAGDTRVCPGISEDCAPNFRNFLMDNFRSNIFIQQGERMRVIATTVLVGLACMGAQAQESPKFRWFGSLGASFGGDTLVSGSYTNGQTFSIKAGDGVLLSGGLSFPVTDKLDLQASIGYQSTSTNASNGKIDFTRMPLELLAFYNMDSKWRLGGGLRSATGAKLSTSGVASSIGNYDFTPSVGVVVEGQYLFNGFSSRVPYGINVRYVSESYEEKISKSKVNGNSLGVGMFVYF